MRNHFFLKACLSVVVFNLGIENYVFAGGVKQIILSKGVVNVKTNAGEQIAKGNLILINPGPQQCEYKVNLVHQNKVLADISKCQNINLIQVGTATEQPMMTLEEPKDSTEKNAIVADESDDESDWKFGVGLSYRISSKAKFDTVTATVGTSSATGTADLSAKNILSYEFQARKTPKNS
jgi:hypothetical protein